VAGRRAFGELVECVRIRVRPQQFTGLSLMSCFTLIDVGLQELLFERSCRPEQAVGPRCTCLRVAMPSAFTAAIFVDSACFAICCCLGVVGCVVDVLVRLFALFCLNPLRMPWPSCFHSWNHRCPVGIDGARSAGIPPGLVWPAFPSCPSATPKETRNGQGQFKRARLFTVNGRAVNTIGQSKRGGGDLDRRGLAQLQARRG